MDDADSIAQIFWSTDLASQPAIWLVLGLALISLATVFLPLIARLARLFLLERRLRALASEVSPGQPNPQLDDFKSLLFRSPIQASFEEFERRWSTAQISERNDRAPIRMIDIFDERPLFPFGPRRSLMPVLPGLFLATGVLAALTGLIPSLSDASALDQMAEAGSTWMAAQLGLALRASAWGFACAICASLTGRLIEGSFELRSHGLDEVVESAFGSVSPGELAELTRQTQQSSLDTLGRELIQFTNEFNERLDRGLQRIEQSTARAANLVSQEQRGALHTVVQELSLSVRQGVEHHLSELRGALQRAVEHQNAVTGGLAETFQRMVENAKVQDRIARTLLESAGSVEEAARGMRGTMIEMQPVLEHLGTTSQALENTADRITDTQQVVARTAEGVRMSLEHAASGVDDQRQFIELCLGEIRQALVGLGDGLGESLQRSLRDVDDVLGKTIGQLRDTLAESNETIDRLSSPVRAAEGATREIHLALDRVRGEVEALGQWVNQAAKPLRSGLAEVGDRTDEISRAMAEFNGHTRQIGKTMEALRHEIHEESRRLQGSGSELGRRLQQTSDAVGLLESATSEAARRSRVEPQASPTREQPWSPSPSEHVFAAWPSASEPETTSSQGKFSSGASAASSAQPQDSNDDAESGSLASGHGKLEPSPTEPRREATASGSGYRLGAARAQGPDPYDRFDDTKDTKDTNQAPANLPHFATPERELGEELKLSDLLGTRSSEADPKRKTPAAEREDQRAKTDPDADPHSTDEPG
ncbi:MAG: methyl-accepting chemotaxis protein [Deltaproteobacteria bacterium]|nr:methyl-accepting chemotaxis protein [Deltaproteobacteria bacterium]